MRDVWHRPQETVTVEPHLVRYWPHRLEATIQFAGIYVSEEVPRLTS